MLFRSTQVVSLDPLSTLAPNLYSQTLNELSSDTGSTEIETARNYQLGLNILNMWEANVNTFKSYQALYAAKERFLYKYYKQRYGQGTFTGPDGPEVKKMIQKEMSRMQDKELIYKVMAEEARLRKEKAKAESIVIPQTPVPDFGGVH